VKRRIIIMKKLNKRKGLWQVMNNWGFGDLVIYKGGTKITVPQRYITKQGTIYKRVDRYIAEKAVSKLNELGIIIV
jgi:hypothetical protein